MQLRHLHNLAGALTLLRLACAAIIPFFVPGLWGLALYLFAIATDVVDGWVARRTGTASAAGAAFDGWVDKVLHVNLGWSLAVSDQIPDWWMLAWFTRELVQVLLHPVLMRRFRTGQGVMPKTSIFGRLTAITLFIAVVFAFLRVDGAIPTLATGIFGFAAGVHYAWIHLVKAATQSPR